MTSDEFRRSALNVAILGSMPLWYKPLTWWLALSPYGLAAAIGGACLAFDLILVWILLAAVLTILISPVTLCFRATRKAALRYVVAALLFVPCFFGGEFLGRKVWRGGIERFVSNSHTLINTILAYETKYKRPPGSLVDLVPEFLPQVPSPGLGKFSKYKYIVGQEAQVYEGNPWIVRVSAPSHPMGFDQLLYFPLQNYPERGFGGSLERFDDWAYVHE